MNFNYLTFLKQITTHPKHTSGAARSPAGTVTLPTITSDWVETRADATVRKGALTSRA